MDELTVDRKCAMWVGLLLMQEGHVVQLPNGRPELRVYTGKNTKRIFVSVRDEIVSRENGRGIVGKIADLQDDLPDAIVIVKAGETDVGSIAVVSVQHTREQWINEGRHYAIPADQFGDFQRLDAWLSKLGRPAEMT